MKTRAKMEFEVGDVVQLVAPMTEDPEPIEVGDRGAITHAVRMPGKYEEEQVAYSIEWESGRRLSAVCPPDKLVKILQ